MLFPGRNSRSTGGSNAGFGFLCSSALFLRARSAPLVELFGKLLSELSSRNRPGLETQSVPNARAEGCNRGICWHGPAKRALGHSLATVHPLCCPLLTQQWDHNDNLWNYAVLTMTLKWSRLKLSSSFLFFSPLWCQLIRRASQSASDSAQRMANWCGAGGQQRRAEGQESVKLGFRLHNYCLNVLPGLYFFSLCEETLFRQTSEQTPAEVDDHAYVREMRGKQLWWQWLSGFRFSCVLSSVKGRYARDISLVYGWPLGCYFWHPIVGAGCVP